MDGLELTNERSDTLPGLETRCRRLGQLLRGCMAPHGQEMFFQHISHDLAEPPKVGGFKRCGPLAARTSPAGMHMIAGAQAMELFELRDVARKEGGFLSTTTVLADRASLAPAGKRPLTASSSGTLPG